MSAEVERVLAEVLADQRCANVHGDHWRAIGERGRANHWACESCKSWGVHVAAEQAKALATQVAAAEQRGCEDERERMRTRDAVGRSSLGTPEAREVLRSPARASTSVS